MSEEPEDRAGFGEASPDAQPSLLGALASGARKLASEGPRRALDLAQKGLSEAERVALSTLRRRMDAASDEPACSTPAAPVRREAPAASGGGAPAAPATTAAEVMAQLLETAQEHTQQEAQQALWLRIAQQLVPDEARILAALSDGHESALLHLAAGPLLGRATQRWLENLSPVGRESGVQLPAMTAQYVDHLRGLGLLESGPESSALSLKYQLLEADGAVRTLCTEIEKQGMRPKFVRATLRISETGRAFWAACETQPADDWRSKT